MRILLCTLGLCCLVAFPAAGGVGTPDGVPPAIENICDGQTGSAFGLCNAYCEAMDCHLDEPQASATACSKVGTKFEQVTGTPPPCECPCVNFELFASVVSGASPVEACLVLDSGEVNIITIAGNEEVIAFSDVGVIVGAPICGDFDNVSGGFLDIAAITVEQHFTCADLLQQAAAAQGVECESIPF